MIGSNEILTGRVTTEQERAALALRGCYAEEWERVLVAEGFRVEQLRNVRFEGDVAIGSNTYITDSTISNYVIGNNCIIDDVLRMECRKASSFGEGVGVAAVNENGGRRAFIYRHLTAQTAYLMTMMRHPESLPANSWPSCSWQYPLSWSLPLHISHSKPLSPWLSLHSAVPWLFWDDT